MKKLNVQKVTFFSIIFFFFFSVVIYLKKRDAVKLENKQREVDKYTDNYLLLSHWLETKNNGGSLVSYFEEMGYSKIAIYGMGELANRLFEELRGSKIEIIYGIDQDVCSSISAIQDVYYPQDELPDADAIVVTPFFAIDSIKEMLEDRVACPIISIEEIVWSV